jgi:hypothetical protein
MLSAGSRCGLVDRRELRIDFGRAYDGNDLFGNGYGRGRGGHHAGMGGSGRAGGHQAGRGRGTCGPRGTGGSGEQGAGVEHVTAKFRTIMHGA